MTVPSKSNLGIAKHFYKTAKSGNFFKKGVANTTETETFEETIESNRGGKRDSVDYSMRQALSLYKPTNSQDEM